MKDHRRRLIAISKRDYDDMVSQLAVCRSRSNVAVTLSSISFVISCSCMFYMLVNL
jgi:hypothetical protein